MEKVDMSQVDIDRIWNSIETLRKTVEDHGKAIAKYDVMYPEIMELLKKQSKNTEDVAKSLTEINFTMLNFKNCSDNQQKEINDLKMTVSENEDKNKIDLRDVNKHNKMQPLLFGVLVALGVEFVGMVVALISIFT